ncbi:MAG: GH116 family glycosyl-hydrolase, partial [Fimbriimonas sp.]
MKRPVTRRSLLKASAAVVLSDGIPQLSAEAAAGESPAKPSLRKLLERGKPDVYDGNTSKFIGMPVGGFFAGTVYLGGDGQLWNWDIFNQGHLGCVDRGPVVFMGQTLDPIGGANYVDPVRPQSPFVQRFSLLLEGKESRTVQFGDIHFRGEYPVGRVEYSKADADLEMSLEAFSPFCPLEVDNSSFPATTLTFRVTNTGKGAVQLRLQYQTENPVLTFSKKKRNDFVLTGEKTESGGALLGAKGITPSGPLRAPITFEDWSSGTYGQWTTTGTAFGDRPYRVNQLPAYMGQVNAGSEFVANSHQTRSGEDVGQGDSHVGTLRSRPFKVERKFINLKVGGGNHPGETCVNLVVDGKVVRTCTGRNRNEMAWESLPVAELEGQVGYLEVVDRVTGAWGNISLGQVVFSDEAKEAVPIETLQDFGSFCVEVVGGATHGVVSAKEAQIGRTFTLAPNQSIEVTFVVAWHFPNCAPGLPGRRNWYASRWKDASAVARDIASRWPALQAVTRAWNKTWYDSTLPYWFLDRTFVNTSILATTTCHRLDEGRFYFWEGVGCCAGTCTHVWGYAQAIGRVFPEIERYLRKEIDFGRAFHKETGAIDYRAEFGPSVA